MYRFNIVKFSIYFVILLLYIIIIIRDNLVWNLYSNKNSAVKIIFCQIMLNKLNTS